MASSKAGFHQKATGELLIFDDITTNEAYKVGAAENNLGGKELDPFTPVTTPVSIANGGTGGATADAAIQNLISAATTRTPVLTDTIPFRDIGVNGGKMTLTALQTLLGVTPTLVTARTSDQSTGSASMSNTSLSMTLVAGKLYQFEGVLRMAGTGNGSPTIDFDGGTATMSSMMYSVEAITATGTAGSNIIAHNVTALSTDVATGSAVDTQYRVFGYLRVNAGGTFIMRYQRDGITGTAVIKDGAWLRCIEAA